MFLLKLKLLLGLLFLIALILWICCKGEDLLCKSLLTGVCYAKGMENRLAICFSVVHLRDQFRTIFF